MNSAVVLTLLAICYSATAEDDQGILLTVMPQMGGSARLRAIQGEPNATNVGGIPGMGFANPDIFLKSCAVDYKRKRIFLYDSHTNSIIIGKHFNTTFSDPEMDFTIIHYGISRHDTKLAYDWISNNFYWTDPVYKVIGIQPAIANDSYNTVYKFIVDDHLDTPEGIAVDPVNRFLFWTDTGDAGVPKIERSDLSGGSRELLVKRSLYNPTSIVLDISEQRIYWTDSVRDTIETATYNGGDRRLIRRLVSTNLYDIALYKNLLIATDLRNFGRTWFVNKDPAEPAHNYIIGNFEKCYGVAVYHADVQPEAQDNCNMSACSDICVNDNTAAGFKCLCREGFKLDTDGLNCIEDKTKFHRGMLLCNSTTICRLDIRALSLDVYDVDCFYTIQNDTVGGTNSEISFLEVDSLRRHILFATRDSVFKLNIEQTTTEPVRLFTATGIISGISYDWIDFILYVSDSSAGLIYAISVETSDTATVLSNLNNPSSILVVPLERKLYWISHPDNYTIDSADIDVSNASVVVGSNVLSEPKDLAHDADRKRIFWVDSQKIWSCKYDGSDIEISRSTPFTAYLITVYKDYIVWMLQIAGTSSMAAEHKGEFIRINARIFYELGYVTDLEVIDESIQPKVKGHCDEINSICDHICISTRDGAVCHCEFGYQTSDNGATCVSDPVDENFALVSDWTHSRMYLIDLATENIHAVGTHITAHPTSVVYVPATKKVVWSSLTRGEIVEVNLNGTDERVLGKIRNVYVERLTIDDTSGNIFYAAVHFFSDIATELSYIGVMSLGGLHSKIISDLHLPGDIAIHAEDGLLFYTERGLSFPHIGKANMDGTGVTHLVVQDIDDPKRLSIDYQARVLYWADATRHRISSVKFDGSDRQDIIEDPDADIVDLDIDAHYIYYIGWNRPHVTRVSKTNVTVVEKLAPSAEFGRLEALFVYSANYVNRPINAECQANAGKAECGTFCLPTSTGHVCACQEYYFLLPDEKTCDNGVDDCLDVKCQNNGTCDDGIDTFKCLCQAGYSGDMCATDIDECIGVTCNNGGSCYDGINSYACLCVAGYTGFHCESDINECLGVTCNNGGTCNDGLNTFTCQCAAGYTGTYCEHDVDECTGITCASGGTCQDGVNTYTCQCIAGYTGAHCEQDVNECIGVTCYNGGTCQDEVNTYTCQCVAGYTGNHCEQDINECIDVICYNGGTCEDAINDYNCQCVVGYTGNHCEQDINECEGVICRNGGSCLDGINSYTCQCAAGYCGTLCEIDINECIGVTCYNGGTCQDEVNTYTCQCVAGYTGNHCEQDINECIDVICYNGGTCEDAINDYNCQCVVGYTGNHCEQDINECEGVICRNGGSCLDGINSYTCQCAAGYCGTFCEIDINECVGIVCLNGGTCQDEINTYTCQCVTGYTGIHCQTNINDCSNIICQNGGLCQDGVDSYTCQCVAGFTGRHCETNINECIDITCQNGGTCEDRINTYSCQCADGFIGTHCETNRDECIGVTCQNNGTCIDGINAYSCQCVDGYTGTNCEIDIDECASVTCHNNGTCLDGINSYTCQCDSGYAGPLCEHGASESAEKSSSIGPVVGGSVAAVVLLCSALIALIVIWWRRRKSRPKHERFYSRSDIRAVKDDTLVSRHPHPETHKPKSDKSGVTDLRMSREGSVASSHRSKSSRASASSVRSLRPEAENQISYLGMTNPVYDLYADEQSQFHYSTTDSMSSGWPDLYGSSSGVGSTRAPSLAGSYSMSFAGSYAPPLATSRPPSLAESHDHSYTGTYESIRSSQLADYKRRDNRKRHSSSKR